MRLPLLICALTLAAAGFAAAQSEEFPLYAAVAAGQAGPPVPAINLALVRGDVEVAADTTDATGFAELPAGAVGEYGVALQDPVPVEAFLLVIASGREWSAQLGPGRGPRPAVEFPAAEGELVQVWLVALDQDYVPGEEGEPVDRAPPPVEDTHNSAAGAE